MSTYLAYRCHQETGQVQARLEALPVRAAAALEPGEVALEVAWSGINYKDALAVTGAGRIMRRVPLTAGIDVAGVVEASRDPRWSAGDAAIVVGCGLGEEHDGGFAERAYVQGDWIVPLPPALTLRDAMAAGTAGFTAALAIERLEHNGLQPSQGPVAVTGATGGVGSFAVAMLAARGYRVTALTGKADAAPYLTSLGATDVFAATEIPTKVRPLESARWAGAIDTVGGDALGWLCATTLPLGSVAAVGLAASHVLHTTVMPFILRGVNLLGINSMATPRATRLKVWKRLATDLKPKHLDLIAKRTVPFAALPAAFPAYLDGTVVGRAIVKIA
jgi:acrylyl-CoA reductase (NADPH)